MPSFRVDYSYYTDLKYDSLVVEAPDLIRAENLAEEKLDALGIFNPMIEVVEEIKVPTING